MGAITGTMFAILFSALAGGIWIGLTLGATGAVHARDLPQHPARQAAGAVRLEHPHHAGAARAADVHPDGRDPVPVAPVALAVPGARAVGRAAAGPAAARERGRLLDLRGDLRLVRRDHAGGRPHRARRTDQARLFEGHRDRQPRRRRHARLPDPAVEHPDHLRRARRRLDPEAVHRRLHPGLPARRLLHGLGHDPHHAAARPRAGSRACAQPHPVRRSHQGAEGARARDLPDRARCSARCMAASRRRRRAPRSACSAR